VEDFGALAFEPRAFACGHDGDGEIWGVHRPLWSHVRSHLSDDETAAKMGHPADVHGLRRWSPAYDVMNKAQSRDLSGRWFEWCVGRRPPIGEMGCACRYRNQRLIRA
jgi:hypothetical protein